MARRSVACVLASLLVWLAGCTQEAPPHAALRRGLRGDITTLDPQKAGDEFSEEVLRDLFEGLTTEGADGRALPALAVSWTISDDLRTYTFRLREDAHWSNGDPVVASDVLRGLRRAVDPATASPSANILRPVENVAEILAGSKAPDTLGVSAPDPRTLVIRLKDPTPYLPSLLVHPVGYPIHGPTLAEFGDRFASPGRLVSNGPYRLESISPGTGITVSRNSHYWDRAHVAIGTVEFLPLPDAHAELNRYRTHELEMRATLPASQFEWARQNLSGELQVRPQLATVYIAFKVRKPPFQSAELREALSLALDREALTEKVLRAGQVPAYSFVPPGIPDYTPALYAWKGEPREARVARARSLYAASGYSPAKPLRIRLMYSPNEAFRDTAVTAAAVWREVLGVEVRLDEREFRTFLAMRGEGSEWDAIVDGWGADVADDASFLDVLRTGSANNDAGFADAEFDRLLDAAEAESRPTVRNANLQAAERRLLDSYAITPVFHPVLRRLVSPEIGGAALNPLGHDYSQRLQWMSRRSGPP